MLSSVRIRPAIAGLAALGLALAAPLLTPAAARAAGPVVAARADEPVVLAGNQLAGWSRSSATGVGQQYPSGSGSPSPLADHVRTAHNGTLTVPPDARTGVDPAQISAWRWDGSAWAEIPVQVDKRFPDFLANGRSTFGVYSGTDQELTYSWAPDAHSAGEESWKQLWGDCTARYADPAHLDADIAWALAHGIWTPGPQETPQDYTRAMADPVTTLDDDDEVSLMAGGAGGAAPASAPAPPGVTDTQTGRTVTLVDPLSGATTYAYLFLRPGGSSFTAAGGDVHMTRDADAGEWVDRYSFSPASTEKLGTSNTSYGPNLPGTVCRTASDNDANPRITTADGVSRDSTDRFPRDGMTVTTPRYTLRASGRWMVRGLSVTKPGTAGDYGPSLIARWKGRAFQSSPDSSVSVVGFEDEQVNWEANSALLGWKVGPVRAIREVWGADSGTNVTKTEIYYRGADEYHYHVRVHPIPPDGLYTSWDYNLGVASTYYNLVKPQGVAIDGLNDNVGFVDKLPATGQPAFFNSCDPTFDVCSAVDRPEEVAGAGDTGGLVYVAEFGSATSAASGDAVPYYRDDACFDDGTGDSPVPRPWPGEASTDSRVQDGYVQYWRARTVNPSLTYADLKCDPGNVAAPAYQRTPFQGAIGEHGIHLLTSGDTDNGAQTTPIDEIDFLQWRYEVPMQSPTNELQAYGADVITPLQAVVSPYGGPAPSVPEVPLGALLPLAAAAVLTVLIRRRPQLGA
jgi:hypothetical protein